MIADTCVLMTVKRRRIKLTLSHWFQYDVTVVTVAKKLKVCIYYNTLKTSHNVIETIDSNKVRDCRMTK